MNGTTRCNLVRLASSLLLAPLAGNRLTYATETVASAFIPCKACGVG